MVEFVLPAGPRREPGDARSSSSPIDAGAVPSSSRGAACTTAGASGAAGAAPWAAAGGATSSPLEASIQQKGTPLAFKAFRSSGSVRTNLVFQNGWDNHEPSIPCRNMPSLTSDVGIFFSMTGVFVQDNTVWRPPRRSHSQATMKKTAPRGGS